MSDVFEDLLAGPDSVKEHTLRNGKKFKSRSGTRSERNKIEKKFTNDELIMDAIATALWFLLADDDGSRKFDGDNTEFKKFAAKLDYDLATEMYVKIKGITEDKKDDELTLDERVEKHLKNSKDQKGGT